MIGSQKIIWKGQSELVFDDFRSRIFKGIFALEFILALIIIFVVIYLDLDYKYFFLILLFTLGGVLSDFISFRLNRQKEYVLTSNSLLIRKLNGRILTSISLSKILNVYSTSEQPDTESIVITHQIDKKKKIKTTELINIPKVDKVQALIEHQINQSK